MPNKPDLRFYDQMAQALWDLADAKNHQQALRQANTMIGLLSDYIPGMEKHKLQLAIVRESNAPERFGNGSSSRVDSEDEEQGTGSVPEGAT